MVSRRTSSTQSRAASFQIMSWSSVGKRGKEGEGERGRFEGGDVDLNILLATSPS